MNARSALWWFTCLAITGALASSAPEESEGPAAALAYELQFRGELCVPGEVNCYPDAKGISFAKTKHITPMSKELWRPADLVTDYRQRQRASASMQKKKGIIVVLKTERCATKEARLCSVTTAAFEKRSTPLLAEFEVYGLELKPRDHDDPPGSLPIETGEDAWKNEAAKEYDFIQGPGARIVFLNPIDGAVLLKTDALKLRLYEKAFRKEGGRAPELEKAIASVLSRLESHRG